MGANQALEIDAWLRDGGVVVTASDRAARAIASAYHRARLEEGRKAWTAPEVVSSQLFARREWQQRARDSRLVLNPIQERALWSGIVAAGGHAAATLEASRDRLAAMAMEANALLCSHAPQLLNQRARAGWANDAAAFSDWLASFEDVCRAVRAISESRVPMELISLLKRDSGTRPPVLLAGFDRLLPLQYDLFEAWGEWRRAGGNEEPGATRFYASRDEESELAASALWCRDRLAENPHARLLVLTQDAGARRGEIDRTFLELSGGASSPLFEFSLGVPLGGIAMARSAALLLHWLDGTMDEHLVDWLIASGHSALAPTESAALQARMRDLRRRGMQRTQWTLNSFLQQYAKPATPAAWAERIQKAQRHLQGETQRDRSPLEWAELAPQLLKGIGWPGAGLQSSAEFQAARRLHQVMDECGSLGFDGRLIAWKDFLAELDRALAGTLFSPEAQDAPILIAGSSESAGLSADAIWFLGTSEDAWPARGSLHPLLPAAVQRDARMPHASPQLDWELAHAITKRLSISAAEICFSYPQQVDGVDTGPSRIITQFARLPEPLPAELAPPPSPLQLMIVVEDLTQIPLRSVEQSSAPSDRQQTGSTVTIRGGSNVLTNQSQCPFKAFATARLGAEAWRFGEAGLSATVRGKLLHSVMHAVWGGPPRGIRTLDELHLIADRREFVAAHVNHVMTHELPEAAREQLPRRYLELEEIRLTRLVTQWLTYEAARLAFTVMGTELQTATSVGSLRFDLRLDRIDRLNDGSLLVVDYKTGDVSTKSWDLPRPDDVQLPLYGAFALEAGSECGGLVFAKIRAGDVSFTGRVKNATATLGGGLDNCASLRRDKLPLDQHDRWRDEILRLAGDFIEGRADVDPRDPQQTCTRCGLQTLCRIQERQVEVIELEDEEDADE
jgi:ATP-dependent helicase/nuclease subunit B